MIVLAAGLTEFMFFALPVAGAMLLFYGVYQAVVESRSKDKAKIMARLKERADPNAGAGRRDQRIKDSLLRKQDQAETNPIYQLAGNLSVTPKVQGLLDQANVDWTASHFLVTLTGSAAGLVLLSTVVFGHPVAGCGLALATMVGPFLWLKLRRNRRMTTMINQLPDVFELMSQALRAGHSLAGATQLVSEQLPDPCGTEFGRVFHEQNLGLRIEDALHNLAQRCDQLDIRFFVTAVLIQRQAGGDLAEVLDKISGVIRGRIELFGQVKGLTAEGRMSGWVLLALPVVVFFASLFMNREYAMTLIDEPKGRMLLCMAGMMQLMGMAMIKKIVNIKV